jgi:hypothetical protein
MDILDFSSLITIFQVSYYFSSFFQFKKAIFIQKDQIFIHFFFIVFFIIFSNLS